MHYKYEFYSHKNSINFSDHDQREDWLYALNTYLDVDFDWDLEEFVNEFDSFREDCGPFLDQDYNSITGDFKETKCFGSQTTYYSYLQRLEEVFTLHWKRYVSSKSILLKMLKGFAYFQPDKEKNYLYPFYIKKGWEYLSKSLIIPFDEDIIRQFKHQWHWYYLLRNKNITWTLDLLSEFEILIDNFTWENDFNEERKIYAWLDENLQMPNERFDRKEALIISQSIDKLINVSESLCEVEKRLFQRLNAGSAEAEQEMEKALANTQIIYKQVGMQLNEVGGYELLNFAISKVPNKGGTHTVISSSWDGISTWQF
jgi:hypothetical protein